VKTVVVMRSDGFVDRDGGGFHGALAGVATLEAGQEGGFAFCHDLGAAGVHFGGGGGVVLGRFLGCGFSLGLSV